MMLDLKPQERSVRTLFVSDVHLGCRFSQADHFLSYLNGVRPEQLYILGDFLDGWELCAKWRWVKSYSRIIERLFELVDGGTELFYTPGNHDSFLRCPDAKRLLSKSGIALEVADEFVFESRDGRRFLLMHGDRFDVFETRHQFVSVFLTYIYSPLLGFNRMVSRLGRRTQSPFGFCAALKKKVKSAVRFFSHFEDQLYRYVLDRGCDGVICGHLHTPGIANWSGMTYINTGDWVENCTALVEHYDGELVLEPFFSNQATQRSRRQIGPRTSTHIPDKQPLATCQH